MAAGSERAPRRLGRGAVTMGRTEGTASGAGAGRGDGEGAAGGAMLSAAPSGRHLECGAELVSSAGWGSRRPKEIKIKII